MAIKCAALTNIDSSNFNYCPSLVPPIIFTTLFAITAILHIVQAFKSKKRFCWVICMGASWEAVGMAFRIPAIFNQTSEVFFLPHQLLVLLAPIWINAFVYMCLGRMVWYYLLPGQKLFGVKAKRLSLIFVLLDIFSFLVQGVGGTMINPQNPSSVTLGIHVYMIGIGVQEAFILCFIFLAVGFQRRMNAMENPRPTNWRPLLYCLYGALAMITIRIIYRLCEFSGGLYSYAPTHEWLQFTWDALPMLLALAIFNVWHPGTILLGLESDFPRQTRAQKKAAKIEKKELRRQKKADRKAEKEASKEEKEVAKKGGRIGDVLRMDRFSGGKGLAKRGTFEILGDDARGKEVSPGIVSSPEPSPGISPSPLPYLPSYAAHEDRGAVGAAAAAVGVSRSAADVEAPSSGFGLAKRTTFGREEDRGPYVGARQGLEWERVRGAARGR